MFLDEAIVDLASGKGGSGAVSFHREKHVPRGGPNGADGGRGGDIVLIADRHKRTLYDFKLQPKFHAPDGGHAVGNKRGKDGKSIKLRVPVGTMVTDVESGTLLADLREDGQKVVLLKGGRGGHGNLHYTSSVRQAPNFAEKGEPGRRLTVKLELKLLADIGLVGLPNAGKSTLISRISAAKPKIADYPFTTLVPNLGVVDFHESTFTVADMPGLIAGASAGVGLGHQFLKHVERTAALVHVVDGFPLDESKPIDNFHLIESELAAYRAEVAAKPRLVALNKIDILPSVDVDRLVDEFKETGLPVFPISAATGAGIEALLNEMKRLVDEAEARQAEMPEIVRPDFAEERDDDWEVVVLEDGFEVVGRKVERIVAMTDLLNDSAVRYLHRRLQRIGVIDKLREAGAEDGDTVYVGDAVFAFMDEG
ncbi:MAG: GTPase ObgE [Fimbriimonadaceae bacterium]